MDEKSSRSIRDFAAKASCHYVRPSSHFVCQALISHWEAWIRVMFLQVPLAHSLEDFPSLGFLSSVRPHLKPPWTS